MPRDLWPSSGVEYSRVRKEIRAAEIAQQEAQAESAAYRRALEVARRHALIASRHVPENRALVSVLAAVDAGLAQAQLPPPVGRRFVKRVAP